MKMSDHRSRFAAFAACAMAGFAAGVLCSAPFRNGFRLNVNITNEKGLRKHRAAKAEAGTQFNVGGKKFEDSGD